MQLPYTAIRVEQSTDERLNGIIRARADAEVVRLESASETEIAERLRELDKEWDVERLLQVNASTLVMLGVTPLYSPAGRLDQSAHLKVLCVRYKLADARVLLMQFPIKVGGLAAYEGTVECDEMVNTRAEAPGVALHAPAKR